MIPVAKEIRYVSIAVFGGLICTGMRLYDDNHELIHKNSPYESSVEGAVWIEQEVPAGQHIIGVSANPSQDVLYHLAFILTNKTDKVITGKLEFPPL